VTRNEEEECAPFKNCIGKGAVGKSDKFMSGDTDKIVELFEDVT
jgi:hypothetical protein